MNLKTRAKVGIGVLATAEFCFFMHSGGSTLLLLVSVYVLGFYIFYLVAASKYMDLNGIESAKNTTVEHEIRLNKMFLDALIWPYILFKPERVEE